MVSDRALSARSAADRTVHKVNCMREKITKVLEEVDDNIASHIDALPPHERLETLSPGSERSFRLLKSRERTRQHSDFKINTKPTSYFASRVIQSTIEEHSPKYGFGSTIERQTGQNAARSAVRINQRMRPAMGNMSLLTPKQQMRRLVALNKRELS